MEISANMTNVNNTRRQENTQLAIRPPFGSMALSVRSNNNVNVNANEEQPRLSATITQDTFQPNTSKLGVLLKSIPMFYLAGFALGLPRIIPRCISSFPFLR